MSEQLDEEWEPGIPLYRHQNVNSGYLFNFREDNDQDRCHCPDAADWPGQTRRPLREIPEGDEITRLIEQVHADRRRAAYDEAGAEPTRAPGVLRRLRRGIL